MEYNKSNYGFLTVNYEDGDASSYKGLVMMYGDKKINFNNGDPLIDWYDYCKFIHDGGARDYGIISISHSSSVDHWFMDSGLYTEKYLKLVDNEYYTFYTNDELFNMSMSDINRLKSCVISNDMKTFQELKDYYNSNNK